MEQGLWRYVETCYGMEIRQLQWMRGAMKIDTDKGSFILKKFDGTEEELLFVLGIMQHLRQADFRQIAPVFQQEAGRPYFRYKKHYYYIQHFLTGRESDFQEKSDVVLLVETLGRLHLCAQGFFTTGPESRTNWYRWPERLEQRLQQILRIKDFVSDKIEKDNFDQLFLKWVNYFIQESQDTILLLAHSPYLSVSAYGQERGCFCHHDLVFHNALIKDHAAHLIDFDNCLCDIRVHDLANLLNYVLKENQWQPKLALEIMERYDQIYPLTQKEFSLLGIMLNYPLAIWLEVYWHYYRRKFDNQTSLKRLQRNIDAQFMRRRFLDKILSEG